MRATGPSRAQTEVKVGYIPNTDLLPTFVAKDKGFFDKRGLNITLTRIAIISNMPAAFSVLNCDSTCARISSNVGVAGGLTPVTTAAATPAPPSPAVNRKLRRFDGLIVFISASFGEVLPRIDRRKTILAATADHSTSCVRRAHTADPVPLVVSGAGVSSDSSPAYGEAVAARGSLGRMRGVEVLPALVGLLRD